MDCLRDGECYFGGEKRRSCNDDVLFASDPRYPAEQLCQRALTSVHRSITRKRENAERALPIHETAPSHRQRLVENGQRKLLSTRLLEAWAELEAGLEIGCDPEEVDIKIAKIQHDLERSRTLATEFGKSMSHSAIRSERLYAYLPAFGSRMKGKPPTRRDRNFAVTHVTGILASMRTDKTATYDKHHTGDVAEMLYEVLRNRTFSAGNFMFPASPREDNHNRQTSDSFSHDGYTLQGTQKSTIIQTEFHKSHYQGSYDETISFAIVSPIIDRGRDFPVTPQGSEMFFDADEEELTALEIGSNSIQIPIHDSQPYAISLETTSELLIKEVAGEHLSPGETALLDLLSANALLER